MFQEDDFHRKAVESFELSKKVHTGELKSRLLILAQAWLQLAERVRGNKQPQVRSDSDLKTDQRQMRR
jgi:hypothetical protein